MKQYKVTVSVELNIQADDEFGAEEEALYWVKSCSAGDLEVEVEEVEDE